MITTALGTDRWGIAENADRRFRRICTEVGMPVLILALILPWLKLAMEKPPEARPDIVQYAELLPQRSAAASQGGQPESAQHEAGPDASAPPEKVPVEKPAMPVKSAREIAEQAGMMQMRSQLADMRSQDISLVTRQQPLAAAAVSSGDGNAASARAVANGAASASGGIGGSGYANVTNLQSGAGLGSRHTGQVQGYRGAATAPSAGGATGNSPAGGRSLEEIQLTFDRSKSAFFAIFNRVARENAGMGAGRVIVNLTIAPDGSVTRCDIVSSSFNNAELNQKILLRVQMLNFGAKDVPPFYFPNYPINFIPS